VTYLAEDFELIERELNDEEIVRFAQDLVRLNSVNPNLGEGDSECSVADYLAASASAAGLLVDSFKVAAGRPNVICTYPGRSGRIGLLLLAHTDTVPFLGMPDPLSGAIVDSHIWGRGSVDIKGGLAAAVMTLIALARSQTDLGKGVAVAAVVDEESEHRGAFTLSRSGFQADACIVPEPSNLQLVLGCKGTAPIRMRLMGRLAHGSSPWLGVNAIEKAAKVIQALSTLEPKRVEIAELGAVVRGTVNVGVIRGGTAYNNVADECSIYLDRRTLPGETQESCIAELLQLVDRLALEDPELKADLSITRPDWHWKPIQERGLNPAFTRGDSPVVRVIRQAFREVVGHEPRMSFSDGYMDMDFTVNDLGIPTVNLGPGDVSLAHHREERLPIDQLLLATRIYLRAALELGSPSP
jgi:acetylornithine deacetylase/succinyl-diaminopimelate desuccinylase-like protein